MGASSKRPHAGAALPESGSSSDSDSDVGPRPPSPPPAKARQEVAASPKAAGPEPKRRRVMGPAAPPPRPARSDSESGRAGTDSDNDSDSDSEVGPRPPSAGEAARSAFDDPDALERYGAGSTKPTHASWMTLPPKGELSAAHDPTKLRPGRFSAGRRGGGGADANKSGEVDSMWTETVEEKKVRLANEVLGIAGPANAAEARERARKKAEQDAADRIAGQIERSRGGKSLLQQRDETEAAKKAKEEEDDPSARAFDYSKDMAAGRTKINHSQRKEMLGKMSDFDSRFSRGKFL